MNQQEIKKIDRYLSGDMTEREREAFDEQLLQDETLKLSLEMQKDIYQGIDFHFQADLKNKLQQEEESASGFSTRKLGKQRWLSQAMIVAVSLALLLGVGYWFVASQVSPEELYEAHYQPYPNILNPVERSAALPQDELGQAMMAYEQGNYEAAMETFQQQFDALEPSHKFYLALCLLEVGESKRAAATLQEVTHSQDDTFYLPALWYESLAYLQDQQTQKAQQILEKLLEQENSTYHKRARKILDQL